MSQPLQINDEVVARLYRLQEQQFLEQQSGSFNILAVGEDGLGKITLLETLFCLRVNNLRDERMSLRAKQGSELDRKVSDQDRKVVILGMQHFISKCVTADVAAAAAAAAPAASITSAEANDEEAGAAPATVVAAADSETDLSGNKLVIRLMTTLNYSCERQQQPWLSVVDFLIAKINKYYRLKGSDTGNYSGQLDERVHCCLYFVPPFGEEGLRKSDILAIRSLEKYTNVIPVLAKADSYTESELQARKDRVASDIAKFGLQVYQYREAKVADKSKAAPELKPMAVIGAPYPQRHRQLPWGAVSVDCPQYSDVPELQRRLIMQDMLKMRKYTKYLHRDLNRTPPQTPIYRPAGRSGTATLPASITSMFTESNK